MTEVLGFGMKCIKCLLFLLNFTFLFIGICTVTIGGIILVNYNNFDIFLESFHLRPAQFVIAVGALTIGTSFIGCFGASKRSTLIINIYALLLFLILLLELSLCILTLVFRSDVYDGLGDNLKHGMGEYNNNSGTKNAWDAVQNNLHCCGVNNSYEWARYHVPGHVIDKGHLEYTIPFSCCNDQICKRPYTRGCLKILHHYTYQSTTIFIYISVGNAIVKMFAIILARMLAKAIRQLKSQREMERQINMQEQFDRDVTTTDTFSNRIQY